MKKLIKYLLDFADLRRYEQRVQMQAWEAAEKVSFLESQVIALYTKNEGFASAESYAKELVVKSERKIESDRMLRDFILPKYSKI